MLWAAGTFAFVKWPDGFRDRAHERAAYPMFGCIIAVVGLNAHHVWRKPGKGLIFVAYVLVFATMLVAVAVLLFLHDRFEHWIIVLESVLLAAFAVFWVAQTKDLWDDGLRPRREDGASPAGGVVDV